MIHTEKVRIAMVLAESMHRGQYDKGGFPYIYHPLHLAENASCEETTILALLHDSVEDERLIADDQNTVASLGYAANEARISCLNMGLSTFYQKNDHNGAIELLCEAFGFPDSVRDAWVLLTHSQNVTYAAYVEQIKGNAYAKEVKLLDLQHNLNVERLLNHDVKQSLIDRYKKAIIILSE